MSDVNYNNCSDVTKLRVINARLQVIAPLINKATQPDVINSGIMQSVCWSQLEQLRNNLDEMLKARIDS